MHTEIRATELRTASGERPRAMVLAAGLGTRLRPLTDRLPKPLVPLLDRPLLLYNLLLLRELGLTEIVVNLHYRGEAIRAALGDGQELGLELRYSEEPVLLGTGGGVRQVLPWLGAHGTFVLVNGDTVVDGELVRAWQTHRERGARATLLLHPHPDAARHGAVELDPAGRVTGIGQLLGARAISPYLFAGVHFVEPELVERIPPGQPACIIRQAYVPAIRDGALICGDPAISFWADLGTPTRYLDAHRQLLAQPTRCRHARPVPAPAEPRPTELRLIPSVQLGPGLRLEGTAEVGPEVVLGRDVTLADRARLTRTVVWPGARVEGDRRDGIVLSDGTWVPA